VLILTPASLTWQWHEEMQLKFYEAFDVLEKSQQLPAGPDENPCRWIISLSRAKSARWSERLLAREYDLLIVDEAHKLKNHRTQVYRFVSQIRKRYVLMLTATPVHNDLMELYNLITILRPGQLGTRRAFRRNFVDSTYHGPYKVVRHSQARETRRLVRHSPGEKTQEQTRAFSTLTTLNLNAKGEKALSEINVLRAQGYRIAYLDARYVELTGPAHSETRQERYLTNFFCRLEQPHSRTTPRNPVILRGLLREVMIRNRRRSVGVLNLTQPERALYDGVTAYIRQQLRQQAQDATQAERQSSGTQRMTLMTLQKQLCSSPQAVARSLRKLIDRQDDPALVDYYVLALEIAQGRKTDATLKLLEQHPGKFLIFTDYVPTMWALKETLDQAGHETVTFYGGLSAMEKVEAVRAFQSSARVMVSTQSGSEGHNLQFCHQMINYDLPWNPMRIEQRVGRLHRLGQQETVSIFNLSANDTIEAYILNLLANKIRMFELVIGELDLILGGLDSGDSFENYLEKAWASSYSEAELLQMMAELEAILDQARISHERICAVSDELSDLIDAYDNEDIC
jgi:superfamily II DNA or RNA helicase